MKILLIISVVGIFLVVVVMGIYLKEVNAIPIKLLAPSQCYTNLQPSRTFNTSISPLTLNNDNRYIKIDLDSVDREFSIEQVSNTGSMRPTLQDYAEVITLKPKSSSDINVGDIIIFQCGNDTIVHRVIEIENETYITKGDNNAMDDIEAFGCNTTFDKIEEKVVGVLY